MTLIQKTIKLGRYVSIVFVACVYERSLLKMSVDRTCLLVDWIISYLNWVNSSEWITLSSILYYLIENMAHLLNVFPSLNIQYKKVLNSSHRINMIKSCIACIVQKSILYSNPHTLINIMVLTNATNDTNMNICISSLPCYVCSYFRIFKNFIGILITSINMYIE